VNLLDGLKALAGEVLHQTLHHRLAPLAEAHAAEEALAEALQALEAEALHSPSYQAFLASPALAAVWAALRHRACVRDPNLVLPMQEGAP